MKNILAVLVVFVFLGIFGMSQQALSESIDQSITRPMPEITLLPDDEFKDLTMEYQDMPGGDDALNYSVRYPKDWQRGSESNVYDGSIKLNPKVFTELASFYGPADVYTGRRAHMVIEAIELDHQLTAEQWYLQYLLSTGSAVEGMVVHSENRVESLTADLYRGVTYWVRNLIVVNGRRLIFLKYYAPYRDVVFFKQGGIMKNVRLDMLMKMREGYLKENKTKAVKSIDALIAENKTKWEQDQALQAMVVDSFFFVNNKDDDFIEEVLEYEFLDVAVLFYPSSWKLRSSPIKSVDRMSVELLNLAKGSSSGRRSAIDGKIKVELVSAYDTDSLEEEIKQYKARLADEDQIILGKEIDLDSEYKFKDVYDFGFVYAYEATNEKQPNKKYEFWYGLMSAVNYFYFVSLYTPSKEDNYVHWSRNTQAFKLVLENLKPSESSLAAQ